MAYLDLADMAGNAAALPAFLAAPRAEATLSALEWQVVTIARRDRMSSLKPPSRIAQAIALIFGIKGANPRLANPRLEALRRMAVAAWHKSHRVPAEEIRRFLAAGYSDDQLEILLDHIGRGRAARNLGKNHEHARAH